MTTSTPPRADQGLGDLERLLTGVGLADEQLVDVDADVLGVAGIERVLRVDEGDDPARALRVGRDVVAERGLAARLGAEDLGDPAARDAAHAEREVERHRAGRDCRDVLGFAVAEAHDRAAPELLLDLEDGGVDGADPLAVAILRRRGLGLCHRCVHGLWFRSSFAAWALGGVSSLLVGRSWGSARSRSLRFGLITSTWRIGG